MSPLDEVGGGGQAGLDQAADGAGRVSTGVGGGGRGMCWGVAVGVGGNSGRSWIQGSVQSGEDLTLRETVICDSTVLVRFQKVQRFHT